MHKWTVAVLLNVIANGLFLYLLYVISHYENGKKKQKKLRHKNTEEENRDYKGISETHHTVVNGRTLMMFNVVKNMDW